MILCHFGRAIFAAVVVGACLAISLQCADAAMKHGVPIDSAHSAVARGKYLVTFGSCTDCHTPGNFFGKPDMTKFLGGSDVGFAIPGLGVFVAPNLTPDKQTGLGNWTEQQIVTALTAGKTPDGRILAPIMPWHAYANLTKSDALAIAAYLKSLPPVSHQVGGPYNPSQTPKEFVMAVIPPAVYMSLPQPGGSAPAAPSSPAPAFAPPPPATK
jgi:mono/diheme cytochrome c family protein